MAYWKLRHELLVEAEKASGALDSACGFLFFLTADELLLRLSHGSHSPWD
jgi:hypothetical protein